MKRTIITYYEWSDIQSEICKEMGIGEEYFRDYHKIAGGHYKDLWHIWLHHFDVEVRNDTIVSNDLGDSLESKLEYLIKEEGEWVRPFVQAVYQVWDKYEIEYVRYFW